VGTTDSDQTRFAGTAGLGVTYFIPGTNFGIGIEGKSWLYDNKGLTGQLANVDKTQFEASWSAGLSYRLPLNRHDVSANR
jgi:hypothetical protein